MNVCFFNIKSFCLFVCLVSVSTPSCLFSNACRNERLWILHIFQSYNTSYFCYKNDVLRAWATFTLIIHVFERTMTGFYTSFLLGPIGLEKRWCIQCSPPALSKVLSNRFILISSPQYQDTNQGPITIYILFCVNKWCKKALLHDNFSWNVILYSYRLK